MRLSVALIVSLLVMTGVALATDTRAEYVAQTEPICAATNKAIARLNRRSASFQRRGNYKAAGNALKQTGVRLALGVSQLRAIPPAPGDEQTVTTWLGLVQKVAGYNVKMGNAEAHRQFGQVNHLFRRGAVFVRQAHATVADFGFFSCVGKG